MWISVSRGDGGSLWLVHASTHTGTAQEPAMTNFPARYAELPKLIGPLPREASAPMAGLMYGCDALQALDQFSAESA
jgi:hypothetical protein